MNANPRLRTQPLPRGSGRNALQLALLALLFPIAASLSSVSPVAMPMDAFVAAVALRGGAAALILAALAWTALVRPRAERRAEAREAAPALSLGQTAPGR